MFSRATRHTTVCLDIALYKTLSEPKTLMAYQIHSCVYTPVTNRYKDVLIGVVKFKVTGTRTCFINVGVAAYKLKLLMDVLYNNIPTWSWHTTKITLLEP